MDSIINDIELFKNFKQNPEDRQSVYGFVSRLFIKNTNFNNEYLWWEGNIFFEQ
ncbi:hypothetical protein AAHB52_20845 [Bacillus toyonensis]